GTTAQYTVTVTISPNTDASLTSLSVNPGSIDFDPDTLTYNNVEVPYGTSTVTVTFTAASQATTSVPSPQVVNIVGRVGTFSVEVTAGDGVNKKTYTINFKEGPNNDATLSEFTVGGHDVLHLENVTTTGAIYPVSDFTNFGGIVATPTDPNAQSVTVTINGTPVAEDDLASRAILPNDVIVVTVVAEDGISTMQYKVTVVPIPVTAITVITEGGQTIIEKGQSVQMIALITPENATNKTVTWSVVNGTGSATINATTGLLTATGGGTVTVIATANDGSGVTGELELTIIVPVTGVSLDQTVISLPVGETITLTATVIPADATNKNVSWSSSNEGIATVDAYGKVTAVNVGTAYITVTTEDGNKTATCEVTVVPVPITDFACSANNGSSVEFTWTAAVGASSVEIQQSEDGGMTWETAYTVPIAADAASAKVVGLTAGENYQFKLVVMGGNNEGDSNIVNVQTSVAADANTYGASWDRSEGSSFTTTMTRLAGAEGREAGAGFDNIYPWSEMKLCTVADNGQITSYLDKANPENFIRDGSNGQVMVQIPKFYYKHTYTDGVHEFWVADKPAPGFKLHPVFIRAGVEKDYILMGAYKASFGRNQADTVDVLASVSGVLPAHTRTLSEFRNLAKERGAETGADWMLVDALSRSAVNFLYLVEYADVNCNTAIGYGICYLRYGNSDDEDPDFLPDDVVTVASTEPGYTIVVSEITAQHYKVGHYISVGTSLGRGDVCSYRQIVAVSEPVDGNVTLTVDENGGPFTTAVGNVLNHVAQRTGLCDELNGSSGMALTLYDGVSPADPVADDGRVSVSYRGLEDLWGNVWEFVDGLNVKNDERQPYFADDSSQFAENVFTGAYKPVGFALPEESLYLADFSYSEDGDWLLMPSAVDWTWLDYYSNNWEGDPRDKIAMVGGAWSYGLDCGLFNWSVYGSSETRIMNVGTRLLLID
ncbi:MAG TPA: Ig-like domain-containing protein, partial [Peptococcaceae bacterium]|nr:Ig-like domain-containing protein [Peptococcaceae bacterium]